jgi:hypothetical protein
MNLPSFLVQVPKYCGINIKHGGGNESAQTVEEKSIADYLNRCLEKGD